MQAKCLNFLLTAILAREREHFLLLLQLLLLINARLSRLLRGLFRGRARANDIALHLNQLGDRDLFFLPLGDIIRCWIRRMIERLATTLLGRRWHFVCLLLQVLAVLLLNDAFEEVDLDVGRLPT